MSVLYRPKASALVCAAEAVSSMESCELLQGAEQVCDSRGQTGVSRGEEGVAVFLCSLLAVESHWKVLSLLQLVMLECEPAESLGPVLCDWEKAALPRELGWINSQNSALCVWAGIAWMCGTWLYGCERSPGGTNSVLVEVSPWCVARAVLCSYHEQMPALGSSAWFPLAALINTSGNDLPTTQILSSSPVHWELWAKPKTRFISLQLIEISWAVATDYLIASCQFSSSFVLRLVCFQHGVETGAEVTHMPRKHLYEQSTQDKHFSMCFLSKSTFRAMFPSFLNFLNWASGKQNYF